MDSRCSDDGNLLDLLLLCSHAASTPLHRAFSHNLVTNFQHLLKIFRQVKFQTSPTQAPPQYHHINQMHYNLIINHINNEDDLVSDISGFLGGANDKESACQCRRLRRQKVRSLAQEDPLEKGMSPHSSILAWKTPWREESHTLQSIGSQKNQMRLSD